MKKFIVCFEILQLAAVVASTAGDTVYITDLPYFTSLAPCAASAASYVVQGLTDSKCPQGVTALQSCACTKDQNGAAVLASISSSVLYSCSSTATEDVASASLAFSAYCNQASPIPTPTPNPNSVTQYITELSAFGNLAACAQSAISNAVQSLTASKCPLDPSALQSCACTKNQNSLAASASINSQVNYYCSTGHTEDISSAQGVFGGYCGMGAGSTVFPSPSYLPGAVSYYITDMAEYSSLAPCAQSAVSEEVLSQTVDACPTAPLALVSCICVKDRNSQSVSSRLASSVSYSCSSTASADVSSALSVLDYYCSAGKGLVTPKGITASVAAPTSAAGTNKGTGSTARKTSGSAGAAATGSSSDGSTSPPDTTKKSSVPIGAIVGGAAGALALIGVLFFLFWRYRRNHLPRPAPPAATNTHDFGKAELANNEATPTFSSQSPMMGRNPSVNTAPVSPILEEKKNPAFGTPPGAVEMQGHLSPQMSQDGRLRPYGRPQELPHNQPYQRFPQGQALQNGYYEIPGNQQHPIEMQVGSPPRPNMNEGPYEMDGRYGVYR